MNTDPMKIEPREWVISQYEDGWFVEKPDYSKPLENCVYIQISGPFKTKALAVASLRDIQRFARTWELGEDQ